MTAYRHKERQANSAYYGVLPWRGTAVSHMSRKSYRGGGRALKCLHLLLGIVIYDANRRNNVVVTKSLRPYREFHQQMAYVGENVSLNRASRSNGCAHTFASCDAPHRPHGKCAKILPIKILKRHGTREPTEIASVIVFTHLYIDRQTAPCPSCLENNQTTSPHWKSQISRSAGDNPLQELWR